MAKRNTGKTIAKIILILIIMMLIAATAYVVKLCLELPGLEVDEAVTVPSLVLPGQREEEPEEQTEPEQTEPQPEHVVSTATIGSQGDLLIHGGIIRSCGLPQGGYDFESNFRYMAEYIESYDYAVANLETTFGGDGNPYQGWPLFNVPDAFGEAARDAGYDMLLTANNHAYDTLMDGMLRTLEVTRGLGMATLGIRESEEEARYQVVEINGIRIGMVCYTFTTSMEGGKPRLNGNAPVEKPELVNYFALNKLDPFYAEVQTILADMEAEGAEATVFYIHWGNEYELEENAQQNAIAQRLCDMGIDVIVGGHPHVVQPVELLTSTQDPAHKTVCIYSLGNAISNQRISEMRLKTGHTEDGALFTVTFEKYSDGTVYLAAADVLPTWVNLSEVNGKLEYNMLPLEDARRGEWKTMFNLTDALLTDAQNSYERTMDLVGEGLSQAKQWLDSEKQARDAHYLELVSNP